MLSIAKLNPVVHFRTMSIQVVGKWLPSNLIYSLRVLKFYFLCYRNKPSVWPGKVQIFDIWDVVQDIIFRLAAFFIFKGSYGGNRLKKISL